MAKYLIVGGVAGGATTAARLRRLDEKAEIILFERGEFISYANCGLPYYIGNVIKDRKKLFVQTKENFYKRFRIDIRNFNDVIKIHRDKKTVEAKDLSTGKTYEESYDKLVLSPGANPIKPPLAGIEDNKIFTLRNVPDTDKITSFIEENKPQKALIVGGGFIGCEMAENLYHRGISVTLVEMSDQIMNVLDYEMAAIIEKSLISKGIEILVNDGVAEFDTAEDGLTVVLKSGKKVEADMVLLSIGVKPEIELAKEAGLQIGQSNGIVVNHYLQTNDPDIYALGDAIEVLNPVISKHAVIPLAGPANKQGRIVADNIVSGNTIEYKGSLGAGIAKIFELTAACTGANEKLLKKENIPYIASITHSASHAGYYPGGEVLALKILFSPQDGRLLGAQAVGVIGVDKRIDVISAYLKCGGSIYDLLEFEQAYAPPYSSAKDPVNIAGFVAENILQKKVKVMHWYELQNIGEEDYLLDVRTPEEYKMGTIMNAVNIPVDSLREQISLIPKNKRIIVFCGVGLRAYVAARILNQHGWSEVYNLSGGYRTYHAVNKK